jgi:EAL domain-containing protein (putative c-di-GMP-specific phosphodiesterase class I)/AmiR/NasT family two-component response regulator
MHSNDMLTTDLAFLVAEDHDFERKTLVRMLAGLGARQVHEAPDGHAALGIVRNPSCQVDIVICDLDMPGMDGMEFLRHLGQAGNRTSVILASGLERSLIASVATMTEAYGIHLLGVVEKPLTPAKLKPLILLHATARNSPARVEGAGTPFLLSEIATGLRNGEFEPFFQPKVDLATGMVKGAEALARWRHPEKGIIAPYAFVKLLEDGGMIGDLTWCMLEKAAAACLEWRSAGLEATVSVNLSLKSLDDVSVADRVTALVRSQNLDPRHMILEVTESAATTDVGVALENLARLRMKGFGLSIDDYGTGYSSMRQLARIAFSELKVDQSFVMNAAKENSARLILESSLSLARKLRITSVAEGVETGTDFQMLRRLRCDVAQGYFIARPMEGSAYLDWVRNWKHPGARPRSHPEP